MMMMTMMKSVSVPVNLPHPPDYLFDVFDMPTRMWTWKPTESFKDGDIHAV